ncbi:DUF6365 family protein [Actinocrispum wychmicini]|uniref:Lipid-A-disaccharide synthase n=1 Tax=Actinocrispum wychmicini TaxID=1213861 RepID=A0A4R2JSX0_9PSEU|nr:DUF6365 family protein [Actinocrispum wychmicini]TCO62042.1 hypothetical protein EV192_102179 [Actinocrispum wychmicini]
MRLMQFVLTPSGTGEAVIALSLAEQLKPMGFEHHFVILPGMEGMFRTAGHPCTVLRPEMGPAVRDVIHEAVVTHRPDAFVLTDYFTFWVVLEKNFGIDPWFVKDYGVPLLPVDTWEWRQTDFAMDMTPEDIRPVSKEIIGMPAHLRPVPLTRPRADHEAGEFPFRLRVGADRPSAAGRRAVRDELGIRGGDRLLFLPASAWQQRPVRNKDPRVLTIAAEVPNLVTHYLRQLPESTRFLVVGDVPPALRSLPPDRTHILPVCPPERYSQLLCASDAVLAMTFQAVTLIRAMYAGIPGMVLTNKYTIAGTRDAEQAGAEFGGLTPAVRQWLAKVGDIYRFRLWPLSMYSLMEPVLQDNPYLAAVAHSELLDERGVVDGLAGLLNDRAARDRLAEGRAGYLAEVDSLADTPEVVSAALRMASG